ncbi:MAG TPA: transglycosylase family protein [Acidimicrobiales bacterium]|nr:transglycosylase family protein [Acidimicrobiales bacterium]
MALANAIVPDDDASGSNRVEASADRSATSQIALRQESFEADTARISALQSIRTTTTTAPPTTTTTVPPTTTTVPPTTTTTAPPTTTTEPPPPPTEAPPPPSTGGGLGDPGDYATWDALAECESGGNWSINSGNGYYGGLQFSLSSWQSVGGTGYPHEASRETQITMGQRLQASQGWGAWPACTAELGFG